jgi:biotin synthase-like enzyme
MTMKKTIETMNRKSEETMVKQARIVRNFRATQMSITSQGLAIGGYADFEPLSVSVPSARQENPAVAARKPA